MYDVWADTGQNGERGGDGVLGLQPLVCQKLQEGFHQKILLLFLSCSFLSSFA
jgi:hypothetical protein